ncbi:MAG: ABC transporter permease [Spirochaetales bacterium]|nr:ABC transporter permease [Spirochaetales bacterium]
MACLARFATLTVPRGTLRPHSLSPRSDLRQDVTWASAVLLFLVWAPLYQLDPNRVTQGPLVYFFQLLATQTFPTLSLVAGLVLAVVLPVDYRSSLVFLVALLLGILPALVWPTFAEPAQSARVAPALGFWLLEGALVCRLLLGQVCKTRLNVFFWGLAAVIFGVLIAVGDFGALSFVKEAASDPQRILDELGQHLALTFWPVGFAVVLGFPLGVVAFKARWGKSLIQWASVIQTVPSIALFGLLMIPLAALTRSFPWLKDWGVAGIGAFPVEISLTLWALLPVLSGIHAGLAMVPPEVVRSAKGLGFSSREIFWQVELPLAIPSVLAGFRVAVVQTVGNATLAPLIGGGGLGWFIFQGIGQTSSDMVILGVLLVLFVTVVLDQLLKGLVTLSHRGVAHVNS